MKWVPMGKSIANLYRYAQISKASNTRYLDALVDAIPTNELIAEVEKICSNVKSKNKSYTGFNLLSSETCNLFLAIMNGAHHINGFTNKDIRRIIYPSRAVTGRGKPFFNIMILNDSFIYERKEFDNK